MRNNLYNCNARYLAVALAVAVALLSCSCSSSFNGADTEESRTLPTNKIKLYFLPDYARLKNDSSEWKTYEELTGESIRFLGEEKGCSVTNAGYIGKEAVAKINVVTDMFSGSGLNLQEKNAVDFINKKFPQGNKEDSLILCVYALPQYPCKKWNGVSPYPEPGAPSVYTMGVSRLGLGYVLVDPVKDSIIKRSRFISSRRLDKAGESVFGMPWKFGEEQSDFFENSVGKLFDRFPRMGRRRAACVADEPLAQELTSTTPLSTAKVTPAGDAGARLSQWQADKKGYKITIEPVDGRQWAVAIDPEDAGAKKSGDNLNNGNPKGDWVDALVKDGFFHGQVNKADLEQILETFLNWADDSAKISSSTNSTP
jgi:Immunity protein 53